MYKNIIFDFGGVVVQFNPKDFLKVIITTRSF